MTARRFRIPVTAPVTAPSWFTSAAYGEWFVVPGTTTGTIAAAGGSVQVVASYSGAALDQNRKTMVISMSGGHSDIPTLGTCVWELDFRNTTCAWQRMITGSTAAVHPDDYGMYNSLQRRIDGMPQTAHLYGKTVCDGAGRVWMFHHGGQGNPVYGSTVNWYWDRNLLSNGLQGYVCTGVSAPTWNEPNSSSPECFATYDRVTDRIYFHSRTYLAGLGNRVGYWIAPSDPTTINALTTTNASHPGSHCAQAIAGKGVVVGVTNDGLENIVKDRVWALNQATGAYTFPSVTGSFPVYTKGMGFAALPSGNGGNGVIYAQGIGKNVHRLTLPSDPFAASGYAWSEYAPVGGVTPTNGQVTGTNGRFNLIEDMGNGEPMLVMVNSTTEPVYAMRMPAGGI
jgi:hypothetical protein